MSPGFIVILYARPSWDITSTGQGSSTSWSTWIIADDTNGNLSTSNLVKILHDKIW